MREHKGQNPSVINWFERVSGDRVFLRTAGQRWTYGETLDEIRRRAIERVSTLWPGTDPEGVFETLGALCGGGAVLAGPGIDPPREAGLGGAKLVAFTSGTSGAPKGVRLTEANIEHACRASVEHLGHGPDDTWLVALPMHHVGGLSAVLRSAYAGGSVRLLSRFDPVEFAAAMRSDVTVVSVVATMLQRILDHDRGPFRGLRAVLVGGGPIPHGLLERAEAAGIPALPSYGMTETFGQVATLRPGSPPSRRAHPLPGVELRIEPDRRIAIRSAQVSPGYVGEPDRESDWFTTSDLGYLDDEGAVVVEGRADLVVVTGGENVDPLRVESELTGLKGVEQAVVVGLPDEEWGTVVAAVYVGEAEPDDLAGNLRERLPGFMVPKLWRRVSAIPLSGPGKPDRAAVLGLAAHD